MCGLAGIARFGGGDLSDQAVEPIRLMALILGRRGPDGTRFLRDGPVQLAFTRLSIVDPESGDQPLFSPDGTVAMIANGEVYNHRELGAMLPGGTRLATRSDCEVLVHLYQRDGNRFLDRVRGIYAMVIWDRSRHQLVFARDRFAIKPLFFHRNADRIVFASEIKALFADPACPRSLDWEACLTDQLMSATPMLEDRPPTTWFEGIESVPAGTIMRIDLRTGAVSRHQYWHLPDFDGGYDGSAEELTDEYRHLVQTAVEESCMSDAEIGLFLSGGVDSAAVAAFATVPGKLHTFTALNSGTLANGDGEHAWLVARALGLENHQVAFGPHTMPSPAQWRGLLWQVESPLCGPEQYYKFELHRFARGTVPNLKVMLLGQASDEFNGGYTVGLAAGGEWDDFTANLRYLARRRALLDQPRLAPWCDFGDVLLTDQALGIRDDKPDAAYAGFLAWKTRDIEQYNCWHEDRTAAGNGIEARVPFLDQRIIELTARIPIAMRARLLWDKRILRDALRGVLPEQLISRPKVGFYHGSGARDVYRVFARMLLSAGEELLDQAFSGPRARQFLAVDSIRALVRAAAGDDIGGDRFEFALRLVNLGLLEQLVPDPPAPDEGGSTRPLPVECHVKDWGRDLAGIGSVIRSRQLPDLSWRPALRDGVMLVRAEPFDGSYYIVVDGSVEFVIDAAEDSHWLAVLRRADGQRTLAEILSEVLDGTGPSPEALDRLLDEAIGAGILTVSSPDPVGEHR